MSEDPVAWRVKDFADGWVLCHTEAESRREAEGAGNLVEPLYRTPPPQTGGEAALLRHRVILAIIRGRAEGYNDEGATDLIMAAFAHPPANGDA